MQPAADTPNFFDSDLNLQRALARALGPGFEAWRSARSRVSAPGSRPRWIRPLPIPTAMRAPILETYAPDGSLANRIRQNPGWEAVSREAYRRGVVGFNYGEAPAPFLLTFAMGYLLSQADVSLHCPVTMTGAVAYILSRHGPAAVRERYLPRSDAQGWRGPHGRHLGDGAAWRQRYRRHDDGGAAGGRSSSPDRPQMVRQQCQWRSGAGDRAARGWRPGNRGPRPLSRAADPGGRHGKSAALPAG